MINGLHLNAAFLPWWTKHENLPLIYPDIEGGGASMQGFGQAFGTSLGFSVLLKGTSTTLTTGGAGE